MFEVVSIDTVSPDVDSLGTDSTVTVKVFTKNSKNYDLGADLLMFQTAVDNYLNAGAGVTVQYRNLFGGAQFASFTAQYILQDISRAFQGQNLESEAEVRLLLGWPNIGRFEGMRVGFNTDIYYSLRLLVFPFRLQSFGLGARLPVNLRSYTYFNGFDINVGLERQVPQNFENQLENALKDANNANDSALVYSTFNQFLVLDAFLKDTTRRFNFFTGYYLGGNIRGEHRDNRVNPTSGEFISISAELGLGAGEFLRMQLFHTGVTSIHPKLVLATKIRAGHIHLWDFTRGSTGADTNTYVPLERQFFAGGPASIRLVYVTCSARSRVWCDRN